MFNHGYALLIGVDKNKYARLELPVVGKDITRLEEVLSHPDRCAYLPENITVLTGKDATHDNIKDGLKWLGKKLKEDESGNATAVIYYSGHGHQEKTGEFYLLPYDMGFPVNLHAYPAKLFADQIASLEPRRLLVVLDCCHAEGMDVKGDVMAEDIISTAITGETPGFHELAKGEGRAVFSSSRSDQKSWIRTDEKMSIFTYHFIKALTGFTGRVDSPEVTVTEVMDYLAKTVPATAWAQKREVQEPFFQFNATGFPIALIIGGKGVAKGAEAPDPLVDLPPKVVSVLEVEEVEEGAEGTTQKIKRVRRGEARAETKIGKVKGKWTGQEIDELG